MNLAPSITGSRRDSFSQTPQGKNTEHCDTAGTNRTGRGWGGGGIQIFFSSLSMYTKKQLTARRKTKSRGPSKESKRTLAHITHTTTPEQVKTNAPTSARTWLIDDRHHSLHHQPQYTRETNKTAGLSIFLPNDSRYREIKPNQLSLLSHLEPLKRHQRAQKATYLSVSQTENLFPVHCPQSEGELCILICPDALVKLKPIKS